MNRQLRLACVLAGLMACSAASMAALPKPVLSPAQQQAAAAKKAEADAKAAKEKEALAASMDTLSTRWRSQAAGKGWRIHPPVAIAAAPAPAVPGTASGTASGAAPAAAQGMAPNMAQGVPAGTPLGAMPAGTARAAAAAGMVPPGVTPPSAGMPAAAPNSAAPGTAAAAPATGAAPLSRQALNAANVPVKSEKAGNVTPSEDVKKQQTRPVPKGASPAVEKDGTPTTANKK